MSWKKINDKREGTCFEKDLSRKSCNFIAQEFGVGKTQQIQNTVKENYGR